MKSKLFCFIVIALVMSTMGMQKSPNRDFQEYQEYQEYLEQQEAFNIEMSRYKVTKSDEAEAFTKWQALKYKPNHPGYFYELQELVREKVKAIMAKKIEKEAAKKAETKKQKDTMLKQLLAKFKAKKLARKAAKEQELKEQELNDLLYVTSV